LQDELTKLKFIGSITAQRLRDIQAHLGYDVPFTSIETGNDVSTPHALPATSSISWTYHVTLPFASAVEQLKHLMMYADQNRQIENKVCPESLLPPR
jgi:hypothetical protein